MDTYVSEQEQVEQIRRWWKTNGRSLVAGLVLGLGALAGYRYWDASQAAQAESASLNYEHFMRLAGETKPDAALDAGAAIVAEYPRSIYARLTRLTLARLAVERADYPAAKRELEAVIASEPDGELAHIARARLARILLAENKTTEAEQQLAAIPQQPPRNAELQADALAARGEVAQARVKYLEALARADELGLDRESIQLKLDNLAEAGKSGS